MLLIREVGVWRDVEVVGVGDVVRAAQTRTVLTRITADGAALVSHVLPDIVGCTHLGCPRHRGRVPVLHQDWAQALGALLSRNESSRVGRPVGRPLSLRCNV
jgi:hypothetical protein